jgi:hypothetical protein
MLNGGNKFKVGDIVSYAPKLDDDYDKNQNLKVVSVQELGFHQDSCTYTICLEGMGGTKYLPSYYKLEPMTARQKIEAMLHE